MKDEIKEILNKWKCYIELTKKFTTNEYEMLRVEDINKILDYITNLQETKTNMEQELQELYLIKDNLQEKNERLNNIIDELEKFLKYEIYCDFNKEMTKGYQDTLDKLKELKEGKIDVKK